MTYAIHVFLTYLTRLLFSRKIPVTSLVRLRVKDKLSDKGASTVPGARLMNVSSETHPIEPTVTLLISESEVAWDLQGDELEKNTHTSQRTTALRKHVRGNNYQNLTTDSDTVSSLIF